METLATHLPFHVSDSVAVNAAFAQWYRHRRPEDQQTLDLWTYIFVRRYFLVKLMRDPMAGAADLDDLVEQVYRKVDRYRERIDAEARYASWVSVICKNTYLNFLRNRRVLVPFEETGLPELEVPEEAYDDLANLLLVLLSAIQQLPAYLQDIAHFRFIEGRSYKQIAALTGKPLPILRAYVNKAGKRLRKDRDLAAFFDRSG